MSTFGPLDQQLSLSGHTLVLLDAPGIVDEDRERQYSRQSYNAWTPKHGGAIQFASQFTVGKA
jgi:ethanolamine phosphate phosphodiesterase